MRITCQQDELARALQIVARGVAQRSTLPVLTGIQLAAENGRLTARGTDLEIAVECTLPAKINTAGTAVVSGKTLTEFVRRLPAGEIEISLDENHRTLRVDGARSSIQMPVMPNEDYPSLPMPSAGMELRIAAPVLREAIKQTIYATLSEDARPFLSSVLWEVDREKLRLVATDINRLALRELTVEAEGSARGLIPVRALREAAGIFGGGEDEGIVILIGAKQVFFTGSGVMFSSRLVEAEFPQYEQVIPKSFTAEMVINRDALANGLERASLVTDTVKMIISGGILYLKGDDAVGQTFEEIGIMASGEEIQIVFFPQYILDFLKAVTGERVRFSFVGPTDRALLRPVDGEYYQYIVMPYQVNL